MPSTNTHRTGPRGLPARRRLNLMLVYIVFVYVPFAFAMAHSGQDVWHTSLSGIAWQHGGLGWLIAFALLTLPFTLYQASFYARFNRRDKNIIVKPLVVGLVIDTAGLFFPDPVAGFSYVMHNVLDDTGSTVAMLAVTGIVVRYCTSGGRGTVAMGVGYAAFIVVVVATIITRGPIAMIEVFLCLGSMVVLYLAGNRTSSRHRLAMAAKGDEELSRAFHSAA